MSSNLAHLHALYLTARHAPRCTAVLQRVSFVRTPDMYCQVLIPLTDEEDSDSESSGGEEQHGEVGTKPCAASDGEVCPASTAQVTCQLDTDQPRNSQPSAEEASSAAAFPKPLHQNDLERLLRERLHQDLGSDFDSSDDDESLDCKGVGFGCGSAANGYDDDGYEDEPESVVVDVTADSGRAWLKVVARNPMSLHRSCQGMFSLC